MKTSLRQTAAFAACAAAVAMSLLCAPVAAQDIQERTIKFGHLNNADHPVSFGVKRFSELLAKKSGGKFKVQEFPAFFATSPTASGRSQNRKTLKA